jgi:hypothetical protein
MIFFMWLVDAMGLTPGAYPSYQWFAWGFMGLVLRGVDWDKTKEEEQNKVGYRTQKS